MVFLQNILFVLPVRYTGKNALNSGKGVLLVCGGTPVWKAETDFSPVFSTVLNLYAEQVVRIL